MQKEWSFIFDEKIDLFERAYNVFSYQFKHNWVYRNFCNLLKRTPDSIKKIEDIPPIPIDAFKKAVLLSDIFNPELTTYFQSSGTGNQVRSKHFIPDLSLYYYSSWKWYYHNYPNYPVYAYVPTYSENPHSSLISMLDYFVQKTNGQFLPVTNEGLFKVDTTQPVLLFGAAFGLLNATDSKTLKLHPKSIVIETGGMKTHRQEITRDQLHQQLQDRLGLHAEQIHYEYGMAELLSQSYKMNLSEGFKSPHWKQISIRNPENPLEIFPINKKGQVAVLDLANLHSCSFILTEDEGILHQDGSFDILGRIENSELRGCNFLFERD